MRRAVAAWAAQRMLAAVCALASIEFPEPHAELDPYEDLYAGNRLIVRWGSPEPGLFTLRRKVGGTIELMI